MLLLSQPCCLDVRPSRRSMVYGVLCSPFFANSWTANTEEFKDDPIHVSHTSDCFSASLTLNSPRIVLLQMHSI